MTYESSNRFKALSEENVEFEPEEQDVVDSGADRAERDLRRKTTRTLVKEDFRKVLPECQIETTNRNKELNFLFGCLQNSCQSRRVTKLPNL